MPSKQQSRRMQVLDKYKLIRQVEILFEQLDVIVPVQSRTPAYKKLCLEILKSFTDHPKTPRERKEDE